jgi:type III restriction enzyme
VPGKVQPRLEFSSLAEQQVAKLALEAFPKFEYLKSSADLKSPEALQLIVKEVEAKYAPAQLALPGMDEGTNVARIVEQTAYFYHDWAIDIPLITIVPDGELMVVYDPFQLDTRQLSSPQAGSHEILIHSLTTNARERLASGDGVIPEPRPENYIVRALMDYNDIYYAVNADLLFSLAAQMVEYLRSYLKDETEVINVLQYHGTNLADIIYAQLVAHRREVAPPLTAKVAKGFRTLRSGDASVDNDESPRDFRAFVERKSDIRGMIFTGFRRCLYLRAKFDSDPERRFAILLEDEPADLKWFRPRPTDFHIYTESGDSYIPDFVVETADAKYLCEPKADNEITSEEVQAKARAAALWCKHASEHEKTKRDGGKPWRYLLIPASAITADKTLTGLAATFQIEA